MTAVPRSGIPPTAGGFDSRSVAHALDNWMAAHAYQSWDPYDGLTAPALAGLHRWRGLARVALQIVKRSPINLRPLLGIRKRRYTKTLSDLLAAACIDPEPAADQQQRIRSWADALLDRRLAGQPGSCWGMDLPYASRFAVATPETPNLFQTVNAVIALLDAWESVGDDGYRRAAIDVVPFLERGLGKLLETETHVLWRYYQSSDAIVFNVNALIAATLQRLSRVTEDAALAITAKRTMQAVVDAQNDNGSWWYAADARGRWVDGFHTGYVLESLVEFLRDDDDARFAAAFERGLSFFEAHLLEADGLPRYLDAQRYPIDVQNCAQAIQLLAKTALYHRPEMIGKARATFEATCRTLLIWHEKPTSHGGGLATFGMQRGRWLRNDLPAIRWGLAPMLLALRWLRRAEALPDRRQGTGP